MAKVSIFNLPAHGHVNPTLAVTRELVRRGEDVTYFNTEPFRSAIETTGARFRAYQNGDKLMMPGSMAPGTMPGGFPGLQPPVGAMGGRFNFSVGLLSNQLTLLPELLDELRSDPPDYVIYGNMCLLGRFAAHILDRPAIASFASLFAPQPGMLPPAMAAAGGISPEYQQLQTELKASFGIEVPAPFQLLRWPAELNIVYTSREFQANADQFDSTYVFVGPSIMPRPSAERFPFERLVDGPLIYISLGTIFNDRLDFYRMCIEAFGNGSYQTVMVMPSQIDISQIGPIPENFIVAPYVPQLELFPRIGAFVTHGGMSSLQEALSFGVPMIVFPQMFEQIMNARQIEALGAGLVLAGDGLTSAVLHSAVTRILTEASFRENSQKQRMYAQAAGGYERAADVIQRFVKQHDVGSQR